MNPLQKVRLQKAASDCGFEMSPLESEEALVLRSAHFPETLRVRLVAEAQFFLDTADLELLPPTSPGVQGQVVQGFGALYAALRYFAGHARTRPNRVAQTFQAQTAHLPRGTEAERLIVQRVGQQLFRKALMDYWQGQCCITGLRVPTLLRASHIKPWAACVTDDERLNVFNGLLLAPHLDALFDSGLMTVDANGDVLWSPEITRANLQCLGLPEKLQVRLLTPKHQAFLEHHRAVVWIGSPGTSP